VTAAARGGARDPTLFRYPEELQSDDVVPRSVWPLLLATAGAAAVIVVLVT
jgi:hypothetical protein